MRKTMRWILPLLLVIFGSGAGYTQSVNSGDIRGTVTDPSGALIPGVTVTVMNVDTGVSNDFTTNQDGLYDTNSIVPGRYTITFTKEGFEQLVRGPITLEVGFTTVDGQLKVGSTSQQVTVTSDVPLLTTETGDQTQVLSDKVMGDLPQVGTDWENFMYLLPGATGPSTLGSGVGSISINGNLPYSDILQNGVSQTLPSSQNATVANFENVAELQVSLSSFSAQYGIGGMIFNQITKSGTDKFHGSAYDYIQNNDLNANSYGFLSQPTVPYIRQNHFGGAIGGPVLKKKIFFYFDYDQIIDHGSASNSTNTIPTQATMGGDFTGQWQIYDPTTQTIAHDSEGNSYPVRQSFASEYGNGNVIPSGMIDTVAAKFQQFYPAPGGSTCQNNSSSIQANCIIAGGKFIPGSVGSEGETTNNFYSTAPASYPTRRYFGRLDYDISSGNRLSMSDSQDDSPAIYPTGVTPDPIGWTGADVTDNQAQITDTWSISPRLTNEARIGYTFENSTWGDLSLNKGFAAKLGWQFGVADDLPAIQFVNQYPYAWVEPATNAIYIQHVFDPSDLVTLIKGRHILHFGGEFLIYRDDSTAWGNTNAGTMQYSGQYTQEWTTDQTICQSSPGVACPVPGTGLEYADFLLGLSQNWSAGLSPEFGGRLKSPQMFVQDDFKLRPNLTLNLGLRYQINHGWNEVHGNEDSFDPTVVNPATNAPGAYWYGTTHANGRTSVQANVFNDFMPRVGASWSPDAKTTVRGGFGLFSYNWSLDTYAAESSATPGQNIMGGAFPSAGNDSDQTNGITPITQLDGTGLIYGTTTKLPYTVRSDNFNPAAYNGEGVSYQAYHTPIPKIWQWNFALQREVLPNTVVELAYVASHGYDLVFPTDLNAVPQSMLSSNDSADRPYPNYQAINGSTNNAVTNYNSLQASVTKRMSNGVSLNFNYVWSHLLDSQDSSGWGSRGGPQNWQIANDPGANYSNSNFDIRSAFKGYAIYQLPFGKGRRFLNNNLLADEVIGGWQVSGTMYLSTGTPYTVFGTQNTYQLAGSAFPNRVPGVSTKPQLQSARCEPGSGANGAGCLNEWFNPAAFSQPAPGTFGNVRRNSLYGPGTDVVNLSGLKEFAVPWEGIRLKLSCSATNAFNHASFSNPDGQLQGSSGVGQPYSWYTAGTNGQPIGTQQISGVNGIGVSGAAGRSGELQLRVEF
ncbi:MAG: TonB-dependent receptor [Terracidiphilus sp.]